MNPRQQLAYAIANPELVRLGFRCAFAQGVLERVVIDRPSNLYEMAQAWIGGATLQYKHLKSDTWVTLSAEVIPGFVEECSYRIKPNTIMIGDVEVDAPLERVNLVDEVWIYNLGRGRASRWFSLTQQSPAIDQRIAFDTEEKAEAWGNAIMKLHNEALAKS